MYTQQRFILMTLDPVHIGTGGYRLGRVDLSIARELGTNLPKIPGTSLSGAARSYAALRYEKPQCAGQGQGDESKGKKPHCGGAKCPVCYTFGAIKGQAEGGHAGVVSLADAQLLLFPVHSLAGPVWVSTATQLDLTGFRRTAGSDNLSGLRSLEREQFATTLPNWNKPLNLGWLLLQPAGALLSVTPPGQLATDPAWSAVAGRLVLVDEGLFSQIVNSNLEVRTSVSIDPLTGAAKDGALFTYEALPRAAWLWCDVVQDDYRTEKFPQDNGKAQELGHAQPLHVVKAGLQLAEYLGVGGMGTRGFGRIKVVGEWEVSRG
jgi:CRISPR-associated protein Cmr4